jgi:hypothetical protein
MQEGGAVEDDGDEGGSASDYMTELARRQQWATGDLLPGLAKGGLEDGEDGTEAGIEAGPDEEDFRGDSDSADSVDEDESGDDGGDSEESEDDRDDAEGGDEEDEEAPQPESARDFGAAPGPAGGGIAAAAPQPAPRQAAAPAPAGGIAAVVTRPVEKLALLAKQGLGAATKALTHSELVTKVAHAIGRFEGFYPGTPAYRHNNPGNLRFAPNQAGSHDGFAVFSDAQAGWRALERQVEKLIGRGLTLNQFFAGKKGVYPGYAPADDHNSPYHYAATVGNWTGLPTNVPLDKLHTTGMQEGGPVSDDDDEDDDGAGDPAETREPEEEDGDDGDGGDQTGGEATPADMPPGVGTQTGARLRRFLTGNLPSGPMTIGDVNAPLLPKGPMTIGDVNAPLPGAAPAAAAPPELPAAPDITQQLPSNDQVISSLFAPPTGPPAAPGSKPEGEAPSGVVPAKPGQAEPQEPSSPAADALQLSANAFAKIMHEGRTPEERIKAATSMIDPLIGKFDDTKTSQAIEKLNAMAQKNMHPAISDVLLRFGLGLLASRSPFFGVALGEAGQGAMAAFDKQRKDAEQQYVEALKMGATLEDKRRSFEFTRGQLIANQATTQQSDWEKRYDNAWKGYTTALSDFNKDPVVRQQRLFDQWHLANPDQAPLQGPFDPRIDQMAPDQRALLRGQKIPTITAQGMSYQQEVAAYGNKIGQPDPNKWTWEQRQDFDRQRAAATVKSPTPGTQEMNDILLHPEKYGGVNSDAYRNAKRLFDASHPNQVPEWMQPAAGQPAPGTAPTPTVAAPTAAAPAGPAPQPQPAVAPGGRNEAILANVPPEAQAVLKQLVDYKYQLPTGSSLRSPYWQGMMTLAAQYDPSFDQTQYGARQKLQQDFRTGKAAGSIGAFNQAIEHIQRYESNQAKLNNYAQDMYGVPNLGGVLNKGRTLWREFVNDPRITPVLQDQQAIANELSRAWRQTGAASEEDAKRWSNVILSPAASPESAQAAVKEMYGLINGGLARLKNQYETGMGRPVDFHMLNPNAQAGFKAHGFNPNELEPGAAYPGSALGPTPGGGEAAPQRPKVAIPGVATHTLNGRPILQKKDGHWYYQDTGERTE